ncbi:hypothetical protein PIROE2DRAFT_3096 [Piromyces sp. E2]|nr:hypothetical protein PIROE2DRAFT_3096 [Piromyces sp. E2]|eukprot:OUM69036.1 hypothetical protein PIROE2DRAFT_3096 [Piromyces sp. E2]
MFYGNTGNVNSIGKQPTEELEKWKKDALVLKILQDIFRNNNDNMEIKYCNECYS